MSIVSMEKKVLFNSTNGVYPMAVLIENMRKRMKHWDFVVCVGTCIRQTHRFSGINFSVDRPGLGPWSAPTCRIIPVVVRRIGSHQSSEILAAYWQGEVLRKRALRLGGDHTGCISVYSTQAFIGYCMNLDDRYIIVLSVFDACWKVNMCACSTWHGPWSHPPSNISHVHSIWSISEPQPPARARYLEHLKPHVTRIHVTCILPTCYV